MARMAKKDNKFEEVSLEVRRVTRVTTGWRRLSFRAIILVGDKEGKIGLWIGKATDVAGAIKKASHKAYKNIIDVKITEDDSVPYAITRKYKSAIVKLIPAGPGTGLKAGSSVRIVLELAGYKNILSKIIGTNNKLNNALVVMQAISSFKTVANIKKAKKDVPVEAKKTDDKKEKKVVESKKGVAKKEVVKKEVVKKEVVKKEVAKKEVAKKEVKKVTKKATKKVTKKVTKKTTKSTK